MSGPWGAQENREGGEATREARGGREAWPGERGGRLKSQRAEKFDHSQRLKRETKKEKNLGCKFTTPANFIQPPPFQVPTLLRPRLPIWSLSNFCFLSAYGAGERRGAAGGKGPLLVLPPHPLPAWPEEVIPKRSTRKNFSCEPQPGYFPFPNSQQAPTPPGTPRPRSRVRACRLLYLGLRANFIRGRCHLRRTCARTCAAPPRASAATAVARETDVSG